MSRRRKLGLTLSFALVTCAVAFTLPAAATVYLSDDFEAYANDAAVWAAGWSNHFTGSPTLATSHPWSITTHPGDDKHPGLTGNPPTANGSASTGQYISSDADDLVSGDGDDAVDTGMSRDLWTPVINCGAASVVWLHADLSMLGHNGKAPGTVFMIDVSGDNGSTWTTVMERVTPVRSTATTGATTHVVDNTNAAAYFGRVDLNISAVAAGHSEVRIRFRHYELAFCWYFEVDDVLVDDVPGAQTQSTVLFSCDFTDGIANTGGTGGAMTVESKAATPRTGANTWNTTDPVTRYVVGTVQNSVGTYGPGVNRLNHATGHAAPEFAIIDNRNSGGLFPRDEYLKTPVLDCSAADKVVLEFEDEWRAFTSASNVTTHTAQVLLSVDGGVTFSAAPIFAYYYPQVGSYFGNGRWNGGYEEFYASRAFEVPGAAGQGNVVFAWRALMSAAAQAGYWAVDNIKVSAHTGGGTGDADGDGLLDTVETNTGTYVSASDTGTDPNNPDTDGDGLSDGTEVNTTVTDPNNPDTDGDGLSDGDEVNVYHTNPLIADTDGDGYTDGEEVAAGSDPLNALLYPGVLAHRIFFYDSFDTYGGDDANLVAAGYNIVNVLGTTANFEYDAAWTLTNPGSQANPPGLYGTPSTGGFIVSDSDYASNSGQANTDGTGSSNDIWTPAFATTGASIVWLHCDTTIGADTRRSTVMDIDVSTDNGATWVNAFRRVSADRDVNLPGVPPVPDNTNTDNFYGHLDVDLSALAANQASVRVRFRQIEADGGYYWLIDNLAVDDAPTTLLGTQTLFQEDFSAGDDTLGSMTSVSQATPACTGLDTWNTRDDEHGNRYSVGVSATRRVNRINHHTGTVAPNFAIMDSDADPDPVQDEYLMTPVLDCTGMYNVVVSFADETVLSADVAQEVLCSVDGGSTWTKLFDYKSGARTTPRDTYADRVLPASAADNHDNVVFAWRYAGQDNWYWAVDEIRVTANLEDDALDPDGDGLSTGQERLNGTDPHVADTDGDGLTDGQELFVYHTDPLDEDTDGDGITDGVEVQFANLGLDPLVPNAGGALPAAGFLALAGLLLVLGVAGGRYLRRNKSAAH